jgi:hypothetical protein
MAFKDAIGQIIKLFGTVLTVVTLAGFVSSMFTPFGYLA